MRTAYFQIANLFIKKDVMQKSIAHAHSIAYIVEADVASTQCIPTVR